MDADGFVAVGERAEQGFVIKLAGALQEPEAGGHQAGAVVVWAELLAALRGLGEEAVFVGIRAQGEFLASKGTAGGVLAKEFVEQFVAARSGEVGEQPRCGGGFWLLTSDF